MERSDGMPGSCPANKTPRPALAKNEQGDCPALSKGAAQGDKLARDLPSILRS
jgi:hypothetical protein